MILSISICKNFVELERIFNSLKIKYLKYINKNILKYGINLNAISKNKYKQLMGYLKQFSLNTPLIFKFVD